MPSLPVIRASSVHYVQIRNFYQQAPRAEGLFGKLFGSKKPKEPTASSSDSGSPALAADSPAVGDVVQDKDISQRHRASRYEPSAPVHSKFPKREFSAARLESRVRGVLNTCQVALDKNDWKSTSLVEKEIKFKVLAAVMKYIKLPVSSRALNNIRTVEDLLVELSQKPVSQDAGHQVAKFFEEHKMDLPANMKFEPYAKETRSMHNKQ
ncbi:hypothetical protein J3B02_001345 [Coemansia erecta]|uniref:Uncharacterized protein n=1 Tax=Coemansia asiatica TaxID=1052880 RepID=A0A9W8CKC2_9FUNG|nr:hypothetical protein LPJ64_003087 [Coemansia asiatica]KAJ2856898.1 hypothetical protein J3B02_001345 [Coemansia erecta]KAJ2887845.1 hypothetical protein FB639_001044 [Coemansia asiatica]